MSPPPSSPTARALRLALAAGAAGILLAAAPALAENPAATTPETTPVTVEPFAADAAPTETPVQAVEPAPAAAPTPPPAQVPLVAASSDTVAPSVAIGGVRHRLEYARRNGLRVAFSLSSEPAVLKADVLLYGEVSDRELKMSALPAAGPGDSLAKTVVSVPPTARGVVRLPFNLAARRTLRKFLKLTVLLRLIATDAAGNTATAYKRVTLSNL